MLACWVQLHKHSVLLCTRHQPTNTDEGSTLHFDEETGAETHVENRLRTRDSSSLLHVHIYRAHGAPQHSGRDSRRALRPRHKPQVNVSLENFSYACNLGNMLLYTHVTKNNGNQKIFWTIKRASLIAQLVKNPPAMRETWIRSLGWEDPLEKGTAIHSSILDWRIPCTE